MHPVHPFATGKKNKKGRFLTPKVLVKFKWGDPQQRRQMQMG